MIGRRELLVGLAGAGAGRSLRAAAKRPNILFLFPDQLRHDFVEPSDSTEIPVRTPNMKRLAAAGMRFTRALTPAPLCAPARACLASGMEYDRCRVPANDKNYPLDQPTMYQALRGVGYHVMGCGKFDLHKPDLDWGLDGKRMIHDWGFSDGIDNEGKNDATLAYKRAGGKPKGPFMAYLESKGLAKKHIADYERRRGHDETFPTPLSDEDYGDNWIARNGLALLAAAPKDKPWFLQVNFNGPHNPWDVTVGMEKRWRGKKFSQPNRNTQLSSEVHELVRQNYAAMIENIDARIGEFLAKVNLSNTLVVVASDHGEMLGDHNLWSKRHPYHGSTGVPLIVAGPGVKKGVTIEDPTTTLDLTATFLDFAGATFQAPCDSKSLRPILNGKRRKLRDHVLSGMDDWRLVMQGKYKYVKSAKGPMLFDVLADPAENVNLVSKEPQVAAQLAKLLG